MDSVFLDDVVRKINTFKNKDLVPVHYPAAAIYIGCDWINFIVSIFIICFIWPFILVMITPTIISKLEIL